MVDRPQPAGMALAAGAAVLVDDRFLEWEHRGVYEARTASAAVRRGGEPDTLVQWGAAAK